MGPVTRINGSFTEFYELAIVLKLKYSLMYVHGTTIGKRTITQNVPASIFQTSSFACACIAKCKYNYTHHYTRFSFKFKSSCTVNALIKNCDKDLADFKTKLKAAELRINPVIYDDKKIPFYTGFPSCTMHILTFLSLLQTI